MAPDRGFSDMSGNTAHNGHGHAQDINHEGAVRPGPVIHGRSFTIRGVLVGLLVGLVICFSNMYFGLQTGWVSTMTMPASLMGFGIFKAMSRHLKFPFSPVENVLVQTVAGSMAIMPLGCGFVGVIPAMNYLLTADEQGPLNISLWKLILWSLGLCYFGVVFAVPLRRQVIIRERLRFPSGFSTAVLIGVLHGQTRKSDAGSSSDAVSGGFASLVPDEDSRHDFAPDIGRGISGVIDPENVGFSGSEDDPQHDWASNMRLLLICFGASGFYTLCSYFLPALRNIPIFGGRAASVWLWTLNPSPAYIGQGIIMGPETTLHMLLGAFVGWGILSPLAKYRGWAPGAIDDWETGSKGWIVWVSLAIMLADAIVSLGYIALRPIAHRVGTRGVKGLWHQASNAWQSLSMPIWRGRSAQGYSALSTQDDATEPTSSSRLLPGEAHRPDAQQGSESTGGSQRENEADAPADQQIGNKTVSMGLVLSVLLCIATIHIVFGDLVPLYATIVAVLMALLLSIMGVRALGETDLNPVSGISKLAQLFFALIIPQSHKSSVLINLVAGAVSEAGALQAGDLMQDLKTGHLLGAAPNAQFWGQVIGATAGAIVSAFVYQLYTAVYTIPGDLFQVPTGYVWIFTARLVTGKGLPPMAREWAIACGLVFAVTTIIRTTATGKPWRSAVPGGIAVAVGMYNVPSFTLARTVGGLLSWYWVSQRGQSSTPLIVLASGFILGEGFLSIINLILQSVGVPHY
ncbi:oligonucleotide transporter (OPT oligopeptide transporter) [Colletotrichum plurivorum]|uniref:Oligonucleotide transporter (OPT oligopeptide transporter) n=1 Tax=Colletotrichum plurivorum TaxID=2175906 RepID=A0A8H6KIG3_9PEZI|nr:oligonucleotide transporter (OPT oligopeptide transporter) [Colletotrichum plurivorum]